MKPKNKMIDLGLYIGTGGLDGGGKTTVIYAIQEWLKENSTRDITKVHEYSGTPLSDKLRKIILEDEDSPLCLKQEMLLIGACRIDMLRDLVKPALDKGNHVVSDRTYLCSEAMQLALEGKGNRGLFNEIHRDIITPDIIFLLDLPVEVAMSRIEGREHDKIESKSIQYHRAVQKNYKTLADKHPFIVTIDATATPERIAEEVKANLTLYTTLENTPLSVIIRDKKFSYVGKDGITTHHLCDVVRTLENVKYTTEQNADGLWECRFGEVSFGPALLNKEAAYKFLFVTARERGHVNGITNYSKVIGRGIT